MVALLDMTFAHCPGHTSSADLAASNMEMSAPAMKLPGFEDISTAALPSGLAATSSNTYSKMRKK